MTAGAQRSRTGGTRPQPRALPEPKAAGTEAGSAGEQSETKERTKGREALRLNREIGSGQLLAEETERYRRLHNEIRPHEHLDFRTPMEA